MLCYGAVRCQTVPSAGGQLSLTPDDCKAFSTFPLAPVGISSYVRTVTRRDRGEHRSESTWLGVALQVVACPAAAVAVKAVASALGASGAHAPLVLLSMHVFMRFRNLGIQAKVL